MKRRMKKIATLLTLALLATSATAQTESEMRQAIAEAVSRMQTMQCLFTQVKHMQMLGQELNAQGRLCYAQPDKLRWEYTEPYTYVFVINGARVKVGDAERTDVIDVNQSKVFREIARIMLSSVTGGCLTDERDFTAEVRAQDGEWVAELTPKNRQLRQLFVRLTLHFSPADALVTTVCLTEKNGDQTVIRLHHVQVNQPADASLFAVD